MYLIFYEFPPSTWCEKATKTSKLISAAIFIQCNHVFSMSGCITHEHRTSISITLKTLMNNKI